ncbi:MAG: sigma 54-interacting transcriptional regulator [Ignavibacteria bacterium]|nr:sigma 54-interacting transcriptional regulator [Ignavibacteria bacterium]
MEKILIVDDNEILRFTLTELLEESGFECTAFEDGPSALKEFIILTAFGDIKTAVECMKQGAQDFITKPFDNDAMIMTIKKTLELKYLKQEVNILRKKLDENYRGEKSLVIRSHEKVFEQVSIVAPTKLSILIEGESGTGKSNFMYDPLFK